MASVTYTYAGSHPANIAIPSSRTITNDAVIFYFETSFSNLTILDSISATLSYSQSGGSVSYAWFWSSIKTGLATASNSTIDNRTTNMETLKNQWNAAMPYLACRFGCSGTGTISFNGYTITATGHGPHPTVSSGDTITKADMDTLREYKNNAPTAVTQYTKIKASDVTAYAAATQNTEIKATWYNNA